MGYDGSYGRTDTLERRERGSLGPGVLAIIAVVLVVIAAFLPWWVFTETQGSNEAMVSFFPGNQVTVSCLDCGGTSISTTYQTANFNNTGNLYAAVEGALIVAILLGLAAAIGMFFASLRPGERSERAQHGFTALTALSIVVVLLTPIGLAVAQPGAYASDTQTSSAGPATPSNSFWGTNGDYNWGPGAGWYLCFLAAVVIVIALVWDYRNRSDLMDTSEIGAGETRTWDLAAAPAPAVVPASPVGSPDRVGRLVSLLQKGLITAPEFEAQRARIAATPTPAPPPPTEATRSSARYQVEQLSAQLAQGRMTSADFEKARDAILQANGLSTRFLFPEEELAALQTRFRGGLVTSEAYASEKQQYLAQM